MTASYVHGVRPDLDKMRYAELCEHVDELESLVHDLYECGKYECGNKCPHHKQGNKFCEFGAAGWLNERIKALGIEV